VLLSQLQVLKYKKQGHIKIDPFVENKLNYGILDMSLYGKGRVAEMLPPEEFLHDKRELVLNIEEDVIPSIEVDLDEYKLYYGRSVSVRTNEKITIPNFMTVHLSIDFNSVVPFTVNCPNFLPPTYDDYVRFVISNPWEYAIHLHPNMNIIKLGFSFTEKRVDEDWTLGRKD